MQKVFTGTLKGSSAADVNVSLGFVPQVVILWGSSSAEFAVSVVGGSGFEQAAGVTAITASDVTAYEGDEDSASGFTLIKGAAVNTNAETINYIAIR
ncbi:MAG: hypothetical protein EOM24_16305 [Chloroflexia bacterium]|nr:hypothetical protein [Chloroflexia bacterium]